MACQSINPYVASCGETLRAGTKAVYIIAYSDLENIENSTSPYAVSVNGVVNNINTKTGKKFVKIDTTSKSEGVTETHSVAENGIITSTAGFTASLTGFSKEGGVLVKSLLGQDVVILSKLASGKFVAVGLDGGFKLTESAGTHNSTDSNRALTFGGDIYDVIPEVDATIIASLI